MVPTVEYTETDLGSIAFDWWLKSNYKGNEVCAETGIALWWQKHWPGSRLRQKFSDDFLSSPRKFFYFTECDDDGRNYAIELIDPAGYVHLVSETEKMFSYIKSLKSKPLKINPSLLQRSEISMMPNGAKLVSASEMKRLSVMAVLNL